jgi:hypothetical protein
MHCVLRCKLCILRGDLVVLPTSHACANVIELPLKRQELGSRCWVYERVCFHDVSG